MPGVTAVRIYSREQVVGIIDDAREIVSELEIDGELKEPAFLKACDLLSASQIIVEQAQPVMLPAQRMDMIRGR